MGNVGLDNMDSEETIERIKKLEEGGKQTFVKAGEEAAEILKKAKDDAVALVQEYEKTKDVEIKGILSKTEQEVKKDSAKIVSKAQKDAAEIRDIASSKVSNLSKKFFEIFRKELLS